MRHMRPVSYLAGLGLIIVAVGGCGKKTSATILPAGTQASTPEQTTPKPVAGPDLSLTRDEYIRAGVPAPDRTWSAEDMRDAVKALGMLKDTRALPRYKSGRSGDVFSRITSADNLRLYQDRSRPVDGRLSEAISFMDAFDEMSKLYIVAFRDDSTRDADEVEIVAAVMRLTVVLLEIVDQYVPTLKKDAPDFERRMKGVSQMRQGLASQMVGQLRMLEKKEYRLSERSRLVGYMRVTFPAMASQAPVASQKEIESRLEQLSKDPQLKELHPGLAQLRGDLQKAVEKQPLPR